MYFLGGDICFTYQFLEDQKLKQKRSCEFWEKISDLSDLTPHVRSYPVLRYYRAYTAKKNYYLGTALIITLMRKLEMVRGRCWQSVWFRNFRKFCKKYLKQGPTGIFNIAL
jgi:hypothetical protein